MLLTIDVGNTNTVLGVFRGEELIANWRLTTARLQTVDEYGVLTRNLFTLAGLDPAAIGGVIVSSVVPPMNWTLAEMSRIYFGRKALFVEMGVKTGMAVLVDNPLEVGADRIVNGVAAFHKYGGPCIVVDFGTAITFDVISARGRISGRRDRSRDRHRFGSAVCARRAAASRGDQGSRQSDRHQHRHAHAGRPVLRRDRHVRRHVGAHQEGTGNGRNRGGDRRASQARCPRLQADPAHRRISDADRPAPHLGEKSGSRHRKGAGGQHALRAPAQIKKAQR